MPTPEQADRVFYFAREHLNNVSTNQDITKVDAVSLAMRQSIGLPIWRLYNAPYLRRGSSIKDLRERFEAFDLGDNNWNATAISLILMGNTGEYLHKSSQPESARKPKSSLNPLTVFLARLGGDLRDTKIPFDTIYYQDFANRNGSTGEALLKNERQRLGQRLVNDGHLESLYRRGTLLSQTPAFRIVQQYLSDHNADRAITLDRLQDHGILFEEALLSLKRGGKTRAEYFEEFEREKKFGELIDKWRDPTFRH